MSTADEPIVGNGGSPRVDPTQHDGQDHRTLWRTVLLIAALGLIGAVGLGAHEFNGTLGATTVEKACGSVWGLPFQDDLNAATCKHDLKARLTLVSAMLGAGGVGVGAALLKLRSKCSALLLSAVVIVPTASAVGMAVVGRQLIWSVSGG